MEYRAFGRTGVKVSPLCLGAMMFGAWGNPDHDESIDVIHAALDAGINFIDTADVYSAGESEEIVAKAIQGRRDDIVLATKVHGNMGRRSQHERELAPLDPARVRGQPAAPRHRLHRPVPDAPPASRHRHRRDPRRAHRPGASGQGPLHRELHLPRLGDRRGAVGVRAAQPRALRVRAAAVLDPRARHRGRRAPHVREVRHRGDPVEPARRRLAVGQVAQGCRRPHQPSREPHPDPLRPVAPRQPAEARRRRRARAARRRAPGCRSCTSRWRGCSTTLR